MTMAKVNGVSVPPRAATLVVAAYDSPAKSKAGADYVCDGTDDDVQIQAAIDALPAWSDPYGGGLVLLTAGRFNPGSTIWLRGKNERIMGQGVGATFLYLSGDKAGRASGQGIHNGDATNFIYDLRLVNVFVNGFKEEGIYIYNSWGLVIDKVIVEYCGGVGIHLHNAGGGYAKLSNLKVADNDGYQLYLRSYGSNKIANCEFSGSVADYIVVISSGNNSLVGCGISVGASSPPWAAVYISGSSNVIMGCEIASSPVSPCGVKIGGGTGNVIKDNVIEGFTTRIDDDVGSRLNVYSEQHSDLFMDVLAVSATHIRSNEDLSAAVPITFTIDAQPDVPRTLSGHFDSHANITEYTIEIAGFDAQGNAITETMTEADGWDWETSNAFASITSITMTARTGTGVGDTMDIGITDVLGLSNVIYGTGDVYKIKKNNANAVVASAQVDATYCTYDMAVIGLAGGDDFTIWYRRNLNA